VDQERRIGLDILLRHLLRFGIFKRNLKSGAVLRAQIACFTSGVSGAGGGAVGCVQPGLIVSRETG
jgi:hypothetical protein